MNLDHELIDAVYYNKPLQKIETLVQKGADIHTENDRCIKDATNNDRLDIIKYLIKKGADIHVENDYPLRKASFIGNISIVKYLVEKGADIHALDDHALQIANVNHYDDIVEYLIEKGSYPTQDMYLDENVQEKAILNNPSCITFILNLTDSLKKKYSAYIELTNLGL